MLLYATDNAVFDCCIKSSRPPVTQVKLSSTSSHLSNVRFRRKINLFFIANATLANTGNYTCTASNGVTSSILQYSITVISKYHILRHINSICHVPFIDKEFESFTFQLTYSVKTCRLYIGFTLNNEPDPSVKSYTAALYGSTEYNNTFTTYGLSTLKPQIPRGSMQIGPVRLTTEQYYLLQINSHRDYVHKLHYLKMFIISMNSTIIVEQEGHTLQKLGPIEGGVVNSCVTKLS